MKTLVAYFSRTGHTLQLAGEIARLCGAELSPVREPRGRLGTWGYLRSGWEAATRAEPAILPTVHNPANYDLVVIETPIWAMRLAPPVRSYALQHAGQFRRVAFFCTEGGSGHENAFLELADICGKTPVATLAVSEKQMPETAHGPALRAFVASLKSPRERVDMAAQHGTR